MKRWNYDSIIRDAEQGDPVRMLELAKLYKAGAFGETDYDGYVYWLQQFFEARVVKNIVRELEEKYGDNASQEAESSEEYPKLLDAIMEAGLALGIYYRNSSKKREVELSRDSLVAALYASTLAGCKGSSKVALNALSSGISSPVSDRAGFYGKKLTNIGGVIVATNLGEEVPV